VCGVCGVVELAKGEGLRHETALGAGRVLGLNWNHCHSMQSVAPSG
jgi:hypothetical protein